MNLTPEDREQLRKVRVLVDRHRMDASVLERIEHLMAREAEPLQETAVAIRYTGVEAIEVYRGGVTGQHGVALHMRQGTLAHGTLTYGPGGVLLLTPEETRTWANRLLEAAQLADQGDERASWENDQPADRERTTPWPYRTGEPDGPYHDQLAADEEAARAEHAWRERHHTTEEAERAAIEHALGRPLDGQGITHDRW